MRTPGKREQPASDLCDRVVGFVTDRKICCALERIAFPSRAELLGAMTSHGPYRESYKPSRKSTARRAETAGAPARFPAVSAPRMRVALSAATRAAPLLQRALPEGMVAVEGPEEIPEHGGGQTETQRSKPALPGTRQGPKTTSRRGRCRRREGNRYEVFRRLL